MRQFWPTLGRGRIRAPPPASPPRSGWTGAGRCLYAIDGIGAIPLGIETAVPERPDLDGTGKADVLLLDDAGAGNYIVPMEEPA